MRISPWLIAAFAALLWVPLPRAAGALELRGDFIEGGLVQGRVAPGARVWVDGEPVRVAADGRFLIGFHRDAPPKLRLRVEHGGRREQREFAVTQREYKVQRIDGLPPRTVEPSAEDLARIRADAALIRRARARDDDRTDFAGGFVWPVTGPISGVYGSQRILNGKPRRPHYGVDVAVPTGTPVRAPAPGVVTLAQPDMFFSGGTLILDHGHRLQSAFLHLSKLLVGEGQRVRQGDVIAEVGATGRVTGAHLDWRINLGNKRLDPALLVPPMPEAAARQAAAGKERATP